MFLGDFFIKEYFIRFKQIKYTTFSLKIGSGFVLIKNETEWTINGMYR